MSAATEPQHLRALASANAIRLQRAALKRRLGATGSQGAGLRAAADVVPEPPTWAAGMRVFDLLCACHGVGPSIAGKILRRVGMGPRLTLGQLTPRQRGELVAVLQRKAELGLWGRVDRDAARWGRANRQAGP